jgi:hypothetical protein
MPDWTDTLAARQAGTLPGFLATDLPLEEQDEALGGPRAELPAAEDDALEAMTKDELLAAAKHQGVTVDRAATKAEIIDALRSA